MEYGVLSMGVGSREDGVCIRAGEVMADVRSAAWLEMELHPEVDRHRRHQMADICEGENADRVWRVLALAEAEVRMALRKIMKPGSSVPMVNELERPDEWVFEPVFPLPQSTRGFLREKIHDYMTCMVLADRAEVIIPQCAGIWRERAGEALASLRGIAATATLSHRAVRRPLWPY